MSLGENSLVAAYQGRRQLKSRPSGTRVVTFIGGSGGIRDPTRKRLTGYTADTISNESETYSETVWITRGSGRTFLCAARDLFSVVVAKIKRLWQTQRHFILRNFLSRSGFYAVKFVSPDFKWTIERRLPTVLRSFLTTWFIKDNGQRTNNGIQCRTSQRKGITL